MAGPDAPGGAPEAGLRVLVVDDDLVLVSLLRQILSKHGITDVRSAGTGAEGLAQGESADLILLDHQLPDTNGVELIPRFLAIPEPPSIIIITGHGSDALAATALRLGAEDYLRKDGSLQELLPQVVERVRRGRALRQALSHAEAELVRRERLSAIGEMSVTLHHELNNPLMAGLAEVDLLLGDLRPDHEVREPLLAVRQALLRMRTILQQARTLGRADRADYVRGVGMIDLDPRRGAEPPAVIGRAALWIPEQRLARHLDQHLRAIGGQRHQPGAHPRGEDQSLGHARTAWSTRSAA